MVFGLQPTCRWVCLRIGTLNNQRNLANLLNEFVFSVAATYDDNFLFSLYVRPHVLCELDLLLQTDAVYSAETRSKYKSGLGSVALSVMRQPKWSLPLPHREEGACVGESRQGWG